MAERSACHVPNLYRKVSAFAVNSRDKTPKKRGSISLGKPVERAVIEGEHL